ncbi:MAG: family lipase, partial [Nocardioides sp.]|nr:family lipase [Nocardioides sp.]
MSWRRVATSSVVGAAGAASAVVASLWVLKAQAGVARRAIGKPLGEEALQ